jgi:ABC-type nitrate/sulfonate/bicarbonate transport system substrate-binding protein
MSTWLDPEDCAVTPAEFLAEVARFQEALADAEATLDDKAHAYALIVRHAARLDPHDAGFERAGVALKAALCAWLCCREAA